jgi:hypothetical protein
LHGWQYAFRFLTGNTVHGLFVESHDAQNVRLGDSFLRKLVVVDVQ